MIDQDVIRQVVEDDYLLLVQRKHGTGGMEKVKILLQALPRLYEHVEPEDMERVVCFVLLDTAPDLEGRPGLTDQKPEDLVTSITRQAFIQIGENGRFTLWNDLPLPLADLANHAVVYEYTDRRDRFYAGDDVREVPRFSSEYASQFCRPMFSTLRDALQHYRTEMALRSGCHVLNSAWHDENRIFLKAGPEELMRRSLHQFLRYIRDAEVRPEQNVDESHPVDIKVSWHFSNRRALIEIKWLGKSKAPDGRITTTYSESRARDGAQQLADYLDSESEFAPKLVRKGYLVVFDARRRRTGASTEPSEVTAEDGNHYSASEIEFDPEFHETRTDFAEPVRFFLEPACA